MYISNNANKDPDLLLNYARQMAAGLSYLHSREIVHLDIKPSNLLFDEYNRLKIADFGLSQNVKYGEKIEKFHGTTFYMAPEIIKKKKFDPYKANSWSFGVTLYQLAAGKLPWHSHDINALLNEIPMGLIKFSRKVPPQLRPIIAACMRLNHEERPTAEKLLNLSDSIIASRKAVRTPPHMHNFSSSSFNHRPARKFYRIPNSYISILPPLHPRPQTI